MVPNDTGAGLSAKYQTDTLRCTYLDLYLTTHTAQSAHPLTSIRLNLRAEKSDLSTRTNEHCDQLEGVTNVRPVVRQMLTRRWTGTHTMALMMGITWDRAARATMAT